MTNQISREEFLELLISEDLIDMVAGGAKFIVAAKTDCCNKAIPVDASPHVETFLLGGALNVTGVHCNKDGKNVHKICLTCQIVSETDECEICMGTEFEDYVSNDYFEYSVTQEDMKNKCLFLEKASIIISKNMKNPVPMITLLPGTYRTDRNPVVTKDEKDVRPLGVESFSNPSFKEVATSVCIPEHIAKKLRDLAREEELTKDKILQSYSGKTYSSKKKVSNNYIDVNSLMFESLEELKKSMIDTAPKKTTSNSKTNTYIKNTMLNPFL